MSIGKHSMTYNPCRRTGLCQKSIIAGFRNEAYIPITNAPDVCLNGTIDEGQILQWDSSGHSGAGCFKNVNPASAGIVVIPKCKEYFVKQTGGSDSAAGNTSDTAFSTFQRALEKWGETEAYDMATIYVTGNVTWNPTDMADRLRESSFGGNLSRGLVIRGCNTEFTHPLAPGDPPRHVISQLTKLPDSTASIGAFTRNNTYYNGNLVNYIARYDYTALYPSFQHTGIMFYKPPTVGGVDTYYPTIFDKSDIVTSDQKDNNKVVYMSDISGNLPAVDPLTHQTTTKLEGYGFSGQVQVNNGGVTTNSGFSINGNVQFVEIDFLLQNGVTIPYHINGQFVILYSRFHKDTGTSDTTILELASYGKEGDHRSTLRLTENADTSEGPIIQVEKSRFENITVKFNTSANITNCIFNNCIIINPQNAQFSGCTFYSCILNIGNPSSSHSYNSSAMIIGSQFVYTPDGGYSGSPITIANNSRVDLLNSICRPISVIGSDLNAPYINIFEAFFTGQNINIIPAIDGTGTGLNKTGTAAALCNFSRAKGRLQTISIIDLEASVMPIIQTEETTLHFQSLADTNSWNCAIIMGYNSLIYFSEFDVPSTAKYDASDGVFRLYNSEIKMSETFSYTKHSSVSSSTLFNLSTCKLSNVKSSGTYFNMDNGIDPLFNCSLSTVQLYVGDGTGDQAIWKGNLILIDSNVTISGINGQHTSIDHRDDQDGSYTIDCLRSQLTLVDFDIKNTSGDAKVLFIVDSKPVAFNNVTIDSVGATNKTAIYIQTSEVNFSDSEIKIANGQGKEMIELVASSFSCSSGQNKNIITGPANSTELISAKMSKVTLYNTLMYSENSRAMTIQQNSKLVYIVTLNRESPTTHILCQASGATDTDHIILITDQSEAFLNASASDKSLAIVGGGGLPEGIRCQNGSKLSMNNICSATIYDPNNSGSTGINGSASLKTNSLTLLNMSELNVISQSSVSANYNTFGSTLTVGSIVGNWTGGSSLETNNLIPSGAQLTTAADVINSQLCKAYQGA